jgi:NAD(P) transhydrogenase subunit alpha
MKKTEAPAPAKPADPKPAALAAPAAAAKPAPKSGGHGPPTPAAPSRTSGIVMTVLGILAAIVWLGLRFSHAGTASGGEILLVQHLTVFVMAIFVGYQVVWNVTPALHTPLMAVTNAISGIIVVGGLLDSQGALHVSVAVALVATLFATINISGGFIVTRRMLAMFRK